MTNRNIDIFDKKVNGRLDNEALARFNKMLKEDPGFNAEWNEYQNLIVGLKCSELKVLIDEWHPKEGSSKREKSGNINKNISRLILYYYKNQSQGSIQDKIYATYYYPDPGLPLKMGATSNSEFEVGMLKYKLDEFAPAIEIWSDISEKSDTVHYFLGQATLALQEFESTKVHWEAVDEGSVWYPKVIWYKLLMSISQNDHELTALLLKNPALLTYRNNEATQIKQTLEND